MTQPPPLDTEQQETVPTCWWHPNRETGLSCTRCGRSACPECLRDASVGYQCIDCVQTGRAEQQQLHKQYRSRNDNSASRTVAGARISRQIVVTPILILLNVLVYAYTAFEAQSLVENNFSSLHQDGVLNPLVVAYQDEWWRLLTAGFLHYGLLHLAVNMLSLWIIGRDLELLLGKVRFIAVYFLSLLGGSVAVYVFDSINVNVVGASGAIYGLLGGILVAVLRMRLNPMPAIGIIVLNIIISVSLPGISLLGHMGGLVLGALATAAMVYAPAKNRVVWQASAVALLLIALVGLVVFRTGDIAAINCEVAGLCLQQA